MKKSIIISLVLLLLAPIAICKELFLGKVVAISDGDTITILTKEYKEIKIRLYGIDCPEKHQDFGNVAKQFTSKLCYGRSIKVQVVDVDRYGRAIGIVTLPDGKILNRELLKAGLAWHYKHFDQSAELSVLEMTAKQKKIGLWSQSKVTPPWEFRKQRK
uniref:thermonuclease family protein n=1 Tax=Pedobacter sp. TaxID=1411316 RepID=UPI001597DC0B|nr:thermonuclease family protein [Pedobacter sp.]QJS06261.1 nuclease [Pedobacter sp.]